MKITSEKCISDNPLFRKQTTGCTLLCLIAFQVNYYLVDHCVCFRTASYNLLHTSNDDSSLGKLLIIWELPNLRVQTCCPLIMRYVRSNLWEKEPVQDVFFVAHHFQVGFEGSSSELLLFSTSFEASGSPLSLPRQNWFCRVFGRDFWQKFHAACSLYSKVARHLSCGSHGPEMQCTLDPLLGWEMHFLLKQA